MDAFEAGGVDAGVVLGGGDAGMAEEFLDHAKVEAFGKEMGGEAVAKGVGADAITDADAAGVFFDQLPDVDPAHGSAAASEEEKVRVGQAGFKDRRDEKGPESLQVLLQDFLGGGAEGDDALLVAFAEAFAVALIDVHFGNFQRRDFGSASAGRVHHLQDGAVAKGELVVRMGRRQQGSHLPFAEHVWQPLPHARPVEQFGGAGGDEAVENQESEERLQRCDVPGDRRGRQLLVVEVVEIVAELGDAEFVPALHFRLIGPGEEAPQVEGVRVDRIGRESAFVTEIGEKQRLGACQGVHALVIDRPTSRLANH